MESDEQKPAKFWDQHYGASAQVWSGQVNAALAEIAADLRPGTALDLGSGEGADVIWLAQHGWQATGVDVSSLAVQRARYAASAQGLSEQQAHFIVADIAKWHSLQTFDLVAAAFLQSPIHFDRAAALKAAQQLVGPGGYLLVISHGSFPPWDIADHEHDEEQPGNFVTTPAGELGLLELHADYWNVERAELRPREVVSPDGEHTMLDDTVVLIRRTDNH